MGFKSFLVLLTFLLFLFLSACSGGGGDAAAGLTWSVPTEREDGSVLAFSEIAGYRIYYGLESGIYTGKIDINNHTTTQAQLSSLPSDKYFVVITTIDTDGRESVFSPEVEVNNI